MQANLSPRSIRNLLKHSRKNKLLYLHTIANELNESRAKLVSMSTERRMLYKNGIQINGTVTKPFLSSCNVKAKMQWAWTHDLLQKSNRTLLFIVTRHLECCVQRSNVKKYGVWKEIIIILLIFLLVSNLATCLSQCRPHFLLLDAQNLWWWMEWWRTKSIKQFKKRISFHLQQISIGALKTWFFNKKIVELFVLMLSSLTWVLIDSI